MGDSIELIDPYNWLYILMGTLLISIVAHFTLIPTQIKTNKTHQIYRKKAIPFPMSLKFLLNKRKNPKKKIQKNPRVFQSYPSLKVCK